MGAGSGVTAPARRTGPLHDPDPYSTPPYGGPGPWAPAPPVQHPALTLAPGTAVPAPLSGPAAPGAAEPPGPCGPLSTPSEAISGPLPVPGTAAPASSGPFAAPGAVVPAPLPGPTAPGAAVSGLSGPPPVPGTAVPPPLPRPAAPGAALPGASGPLPAPGMAVPVPSGPLPASGAAVPAPPTPLFAPTTPLPAPGAAVLTLLSAVPSAPVCPAAVLPSAGSGPLGGGSWGRYDPWRAGAAGEPTAVRGTVQRTRAKVFTRAQRFVVGWVLAVAVVFGGVGGAAGAYVGRAGAGDPAGRAPDSVAGIAARALPGVVTLHVRGAGAAGTGTGFVLDTQGDILTNDHVVEPAGADGGITVTFSGGDTVQAEVVGRDSGYDLAVVRVRGGHGLVPLPLGDSDDVRVGDPVVAIGAPFGLADTVTSGIISAKGRPVTAGGEKSDGGEVSYVDALQTDAPLNPGNSGGPLLDSSGRVVGVNSAIRSAGDGQGGDGGQAGSIGLGFALPVNQARRIAGELIADGRATHPVLGVTLDLGYTGDGARIDDANARGGSAVTRGGPAARAGLRPGDVVTAVGGGRVHTGEELIGRIRAHRSGDRLRLTVERGGDEREVSLVLGASERN
ncbi:trypsin-like peptidase domain-containing protein [Streptomyces sp. NPDC051132]|uniref:S1C family serine protease n=1 Tax=unclassified Streptomyces TaxID=2593676 RepID=UPI0034486E00